MVMGGWRWFYPHIPWFVKRKNVGYDVAKYSIMYHRPLAIHRASGSLETGRGSSITKV